MGTAAQPLDQVTPKKLRLELTKANLKTLASGTTADAEPWRAILAQAGQAVALEARALARRIELLTAGGARASGIGKVWHADTGTWAEPATPPYRRRDILILLKATGRQEVYEAALRERGIPYTTDGKGRGFLTRQEVQDVASLLAWLAFAAPVRIRDRRHPRIR